MSRKFQRFVQNESGATAIEYTLIAALIAGALLSIWPDFYASFLASWTNAGSAINGAVSAATK